jgi:hypothetical protein
MAKPFILPSKAKWDMSKGYEDFFNEDNSDDKYDIEIEDGFEDRECLRRIQADNKAARDKGKGKADPPPMSYILHPSIHGKWASRRIDTLQDAQDLEQAMQDGDSFALGYMSYINSVEQIPTNPHSMGVEHFIK